MIGLLAMSGPVTVMNTTRLAPAHACIIWSNSAGVMRPLLPRATITTGGSWPALRRAWMIPMPTFHWRPTAASIEMSCEVSVAAAYSFTSSSTESPTAIPGPGGAGATIVVVVALGLLVGAVAGVVAAVGVVAGLVVAAVGVVGAADPGAVAERRPVAVHDAVTATS